MLIHRRRDAIVTLCVGALMKIGIGSWLRGLRLPDVCICSPNPEKVIVYGDTNAIYLLSTYILKNIAYQVVRRPYDSEQGAVYLYISVSVIIRMIANVKLAFRDIPPLQMSEKIRYIVGNHIRVYRLSVIEAHRPEVVLSINDADFNFQWMSRYCKSIKFLAIANSPRTEINLVHELPKRPPHPAATVYLQYLFAHGEIERDLFAKLGHKIENFIVSGPVRSGYYRAEMAFSNPQKIFDICLVSQYAESIMEQGHEPEIKHSLLALYPYLRSYVTKKNLTLCIALRGNSRKEVDHFTEHFGPGIFMQANSMPGMSTYFLMDASDIVVTFDSSAGREAFCWGKKTLFANYSGNPVRNCIANGPWLLEGGGYDEFESALDMLREMDADQYGKTSQSIRHSLMQFDNARPGHTIIREYLLDLLGQN